MTTIRVLALAIAGCLLAAADCRAAYSIYLQTSNPIIEGESTDKGFEKAWRLVGFAQDVKLPISEANGLRDLGRSQLSDVAVAKFLDKASALLLLRAANGAPIASVTISFMNYTGGTPVLFYKVILEDVVVSSVAQEANDGTVDDTLKEQVKLNFRKITWSYIPQDPSGKSGTPITTSWDLNTSK